MKDKCIKVAVSLPIRKTFSYLIPKHLPLQDYTGYRVIVPFKNQKIVGFVLGESDESREIELKEIIDVIDSEPLFTKKMVPFFEWLSNYYFYPIGQVIQSALPPGINVRRFVTASITKKGEKAIDELPKDSKDREILSWIKSNPEKRLNFPVKLINNLYKKGWIKIKRQIKKRDRAPLMRKFVRIKENVDIDKLNGLKEEERSPISIIRD